MGASTSRSRPSRSRRRPGHALHEITACDARERVRRDFVTNISHELRTPLASVKLLAETLSAGAVEDAATARQFAVQIEREVDHLAQLVAELLDLSMIESGETKLARAGRPGCGVATWPSASARSPRGVAWRSGGSRGPPGPGPRSTQTPAGSGRRSSTWPQRGEVQPARAARSASAGSRLDGRCGSRWPMTGSASRVASAADLRALLQGGPVPGAGGRRDDGGGSAGLGLRSCGTWPRRTAAAVGVRSVEGEGSTFWIEMPSPDGLIQLVEVNHLSIAHGTRSPDRATRASRRGAPSWYAHAQIRRQLERELQAEQSLGLGEYEVLLLPRLRAESGSCA